MLLRRIDISGVRNIRRASLTPLSPINIIYGDNGAGKTTILEAISLLSTAKSFRSHKLGPIIQRETDVCTVFGEVKSPRGSYQPVGVERSRRDSASINIKIGGERVRSVSQLAENLPLQVISADTFRLLEGSPSVRRQYLDWGVFHVEQQYYHLWKTARRCLKQRNHLLRSGHIDQKQLATWTHELAVVGAEIDRLRQDYIRQLKPVFDATLAQLIELEGVSLSYNRGWDKERSLQDVYERQTQKDIAQGFTGFGPHRADLRVRHQQSNAAETLSRGQQKLVVSALRVAQGYVLSELARKPCVYLIDDLPAELDENRRKALCALLQRLGSQVFITCVDPGDLESCWDESVELSMFHVKHGEVSRQ